MGKNTGNRRAKDKSTRRKEARRKEIREGRRMAQIVEIFLWMLLILTQASLIRVMEVRAEMRQEEQGEEFSPASEEEQRPVQITVFSEMQMEKENCKEPEAVYKRGQTPYFLSSWFIQAVSVSESRRMEEQTVVYEAAELASEIPHTLDVEAEMNGRKAVVRCRKTGQKILKETWSNDFELPVTFHQYDAETYVLGETEIAHCAERPALAGQEQLLLQHAGLSQEGYRIHQIEWDGYAYQDEQGILCRDAKAKGERLLRDYLVTYRGVAVFPACQGWRTVAVYKLPKPESDAKASISTEEASVAQESLPAPSSQAADWRQIITRTLMLTIGAGTILFVIFLLFLCVRRMTKRRKV